VKWFLYDALEGTHTTALLDYSDVRYDTAKRSSFHIVRFRSKEPSCVENTEFATCWRTFPNGVDDILFLINLYSPEKAARTVE